MNCLSDSSSSTSSLAVYHSLLALLRSISLFVVPSCFFAIILVFLWMGDRDSWGCGEEVVRLPPSPPIPFSPAFPSPLQKVGGGGLPGGAGGGWMGIPSGGQAVSPCPSPSALGIGSNPAGLPKDLCSEVLNSVSDAKFSQDGRFIFSRDYLTVRFSTSPCVAVEFDFAMNATCCFL